MRKTKKKNPTILLLIILIAIILGLGSYGYAKVLNTDLIYEGVKVGEFDVGLMTKEEALNFLKDKKEKEIDENKMTLTYEDKEYSINLRDIGFYFEYKKAVDEAYSVGREGNVFIRLKDISRSKKEGVQITLNSDYDKEKIDNIVDIIAQEIDVEVKEAEFHFNNGNIKVTEDVVGKSIKKEELVQLINDNVYVLNNIEIPVEDIIPQKTKALLSRVNGVIGEFSTSFKGSSSDRVENIRISSKAVSNKLIMPGDTVSFNQTTGPREKKYGYREAIVILEGDFTPGVGGGVCQTSTTLYNALLLANVTIVERSHHSIPAKYVKFGQDAAVSYGHMDLKFRNDFDYPIYINSRVSGDRVYFYVYGDRNARDYIVKIKPEIVETIVLEDDIIVDNSLEPGTKEVVQRGRTGYKVNTYKSIIRNGKVVSKDLITRDFYKPRKFIYRVGPEPLTTKFSDEDREESPTEDISIEDDNTDD
ncbi:MAG: hypothetical protein GX987_00360 [Tissierellia bacterium]|nr:hypothetical protein [Tissierellia bacterium]